MSVLTTRRLGSFALGRVFNSQGSIQSLIDIKRFLGVVAADLDDGDLPLVRKAKEDTPPACNTRRMRRTNPIDSGTGEPIVARFAAAVRKA